MDTTKATPQLFAALADAQAEIENASKNANNKHFSSKYADLAEVLTTIRNTLPKHGLSIIQSPSFDGSLVHVTTLIAHKEGGYIISQASCVPAKSDAQGVGAATTYLRRYSAAALAGIAQADDDGNAAAHNRKPAPVKQLPAGRPTDGAWDGVTEEERVTLEADAALISEHHEMGDIKAAHAIYENTKNELRTALWTLLNSKVRSDIKKYHDANKQNVERAA